MEPLNFPFQSSHAAPLPKCLIEERIAEHKLKPNRAKRVMRVIRRPESRGKNILLARCTCRASREMHKLDPFLAAVPIIRCTMTVEGWLLLDYYLGSCPMCGIIYWA